MSLSLNFGTQPAPLDGGSDLVKSLKTDIPAELRFLADPSKFIGHTLGDSVSAHISLAFSPSAPLSWDLGASGNVTFGFAPSASGSVSIQTSGKLFSYTLGDDSPVDVPVPEGHAYVSIAFDMSLGVSLEGDFSSGNVGVSAKVADRNTFTVAFRKAFPLTADTAEAIREAFEAFTLPFQPESIARLGDGDHLDYQYCGKISTGFGATYGVSGNVLGGRSTGEISRSFDVSPMAKAVVSARPAFQAGVSFALEYEHTAVFRVLVSRDANAAKLVYFFSSSQEVETTEKLGIAFSGNPSFNLSKAMPGLAARAAASAFSGVAGPVGTTVRSGLANALATDSSGQVQKYIGDVNSGINGLLASHDGQKIELQFQQERISTNMALFSFDFDLTQPEALSVGYAKAVAGDFRGAIAAAGVTLEPGAYVEHLWTTRTSVSFQFFDLFKAADATEYYHKTRLVYAGNRTFRLIFQTGVKDTITVNSKENSCEVYFTASAAADGAGAASGDLVVTLNFTTIDQTAAAAQETKRALVFIGGQDLQRAAVGIPEQLTGALTVNCRFTQAAFGKFTCDEYAGSKPPNLPHPRDAANYTAFLAAVHGIVPPDNFNHDFLRFFASYDSWVEFNRVKNDEEGSRMIPDRLQQGNAAVNVWPAASPVSDNAERSSLQCYLYSAQAFMNLCDSLEHLSGDLAAGDFDGNFGLLMDSLRSIISQDIPVYFVKPALAALFRAAQCSALGVESTQTGKDMRIVFAADTGSAAVRTMTA